MDSPHTPMTRLSTLTQENEALRHEVEILKSVFRTHYGSLVMHLRLKETMKGTQEWVDLQKASVQELKGFVQDDEIVRCISHKQRPYRDRD